MTDSAMCDADDLNDNDIIGVIKIKDGLFICDELGAQVSTHGCQMARLISNCKSSTPG